MGLPNFRRNWILSGLVASGGQASVEGDLEGVQRGLPAVGPACAALAGRVQAHDREVDALECCLLVREVSAGVDSATETGGAARDGLRGADERADGLVELQERDKFGPRVGPQPDDRRVAF